MMMMMMMGQGKGDGGLTGQPVFGFDSGGNVVNLTTPPTGTKPANDVSGLATATKSVDSSPKNPTKLNMADLDGEISE